MIRTDNLTKTFDDFTALSGVNCKIPDGCFLTIKKEFAVTDKNGKPIIGIELHQEQSSQQ